MRRTLRKRKSDSMSNTLETTKRRNDETARSPVRPFPDSLGRLILLVFAFQVLASLAAWAAGGSLKFGGVPVSPGSTVQASVPLSGMEKSYAAQGGNVVPSNAIAVLATPSSFDPTRNWPFWSSVQQAMVNVRTETI